jgi:hypothetical protein
MALRVIRAGVRKKKAPNPGGGVGRKKRVMRMMPGGKTGTASDVFRLDGGHYR